MDRGKREALSHFFGSAGFYIALLLCVLAIAAVGYFALIRGVNDDTEPMEGQMDQSPSVSQVTGLSEIPEEEPTAPVTQPEEVEMPEETVEVDALPEVLPDTEPVAAEVPQVIVRPVAGEVVATFSGDELRYNETTADWRTHGGIDIAADAGTQVVAASAGTVVAVAEDPRLGTTVTIAHTDGYETTYASLQEDVLVEEGDQVSSGQAIATVGNTTLTESALGAHLHFAVTQDGQPVDPEAYLAQG